MFKIAENARERGNLRDAEYIEGQAADTCCIGKQCMAWRHLRDGHANSDIPAKSEGYCGLAGQSEY